MDSSYFDDDIKRLHASFIEAMESNRNYTSFSEDDLVDIFDYACSISDEYIITEVIIAGERCFPESKELIKRKALMYHRLGQDDACIAVISQFIPDSYLNLIIEAKNETSVSSWLPLFKKQLSLIKTGTIEDGDIIFTVDFFDRINHIEVLTSCVNELSRISEYPSTIFNELFHLLWEKGFFLEASEFGRKLTELEPFNAMAWTELADLYNVNLGNIEEALECADFALAIDPNHVGALMVASSALYESKPEKSRDIVTKIMQIAPNDPMSYYSRAILNINDGNIDQGVSDIIKSISLSPISGRNELLELLFKAIDKPLNSSDENIVLNMLEDNDTIDAVKLCRTLISSGYNIGAYEAFKLAKSARIYEFGESEAFYLAVEILYRNKMYNQVIELIDLGCSNNKDMLLSMPMLLALVYSLSWYRTTPKARQKIVCFIKERIALYNPSVRIGKLADFMCDESSIRRLNLLLNELASNNDYPNFRDIDPYIIC